MMRHRFVPCAFLFIISAVAYLNADHEEFLFDSAHQNIARAEHTEDPIQVTRAFWQGELNPDAPFTYLTFAWNYFFNKALGLDGFDITTFLVFNIMIHALNACLLYFLVRCFLFYLEPDCTGAVFIPLAAATIFAV
ncbi:MAG: hypothetical protein JSV03_05160, partial [Planctomycetota bacterium]